MPVEGRTLGRLQSRADRSVLAREVVLPTARYIRVQEIAGLPLIIAAAAALIWINVAEHSYEAIWEEVVTLELFFFSRSEPVREWISDLLLPLFFFAAGLELKREAVHGSLSTWSKATLPLVAAVGGMVVPGAIYLAFNASGEGSRGWAIPMATDIAFALAVLGVLGKRVPQELRIFVLAFAAADDLGAVLLIAIFYTSDISWAALAVAAGFLGLIIAFRQLGVRAMVVYWALGAGFLLGVMMGGVHATVAGIILGVLAPATAPVERARARERVHAVARKLEEEHAAPCGDEEEARERENRALGELERVVQDSEPATDRLLDIMNPIASYAILPLFALSHAGVKVDLTTLGEAMTAGVSWGILAGLLLGKPIGFVVASWLVTKAGWATLPESVNWRQFLGAGVVAGIGFTISLFIAQLAFESELLADAKIAILGASVLAAVAGGGILWWGSRGKKQAAPPESEAQD